MPRRASDLATLPRVGAVLRTLREAASLTVADVAVICRVGRKTWYRREKLGTVPPGPQLHSFAAAVDPKCPLRAKAQILAAAGLLTTGEAGVLTRYAEGV